VPPTTTRPPIKPEVVDTTVSISSYVLFDVDKADLTIASESALVGIRDLAIVHADALVEIRGYTDADGSEEYNLDLSRRRAETVLHWLTERGSESSRITEIGLGETKPIASNDTVEGKAKNRRVEIAVHSG